MSMKWDKWMEATWASRGTNVQHLIVNLHRAIPDRDFMSPTFRSGVADILRRTSTPTERDGLTA